MPKHPHSGEIIRAEIMEPLGLTVENAARRFSVPVGVLTAVLAGSTPVSQELAQGLEQAGYSTARFWLAL